MVNNSAQFPQAIFTCSICDYYTSRKNDYTRHLLTPKHCNANKKQIYANDAAQNPQQHECCQCGKKYKHRSSLCKHKKLCVNPEPLKIDTNLVIELLKQNKEKEMNDKEMMMIILKENSELKTMILDMCKTMTATASSGTTNNNNNMINNTTHNFNLNVFLNETCKDALNLADFVSSLQVKLKDLEETAKIGYTEGVSRIFINGLNELDVNMRPIHCSDLKRETLYVKNDDKWTKEQPDKTNITKAIKKVSNKNIQQIFEWQKKYPCYKNPESKQNDKYQEMLFTAMGGSTDEEQSNNIDKIIRNITKEVVINKNI
jgi:hypothetical protein